MSDERNVIPIWDRNLKRIREHLAQLRKQPMRATGILAIFESADGLSKVDRVVYPPPPRIVRALHRKTVVSPSASPFDTPMAGCREYRLVGYTDRFNGAPAVLYEEITT